ncbi:spindle assembly abnormal protein 6 homolog [Halichondria panicea]|uniref:spindle assembly abnormal protein 6 homolog n=1 Tax=Halichondria panicea TaxID=6063 RepID=UPI00312B84F6
MEQLFDKTVSVGIQSSDRDDRQTTIGITVLLNTVTTPIHKKELLIRLTDDSDPFFLFTLALGEGDFQGLKSQQGLLVDFSAFPQKFIDLLELCIAETGKLSPKFLLQLSLGATEGGMAVLNVVETNPFRHLNHLSLKFVPASDTYLKKYLAECLLGLKEENCYLSESLTTTRTDLSAQLAQCEETLSRRSSELESLKAQWNAHATTLSSEHSVSLSSEREKALQTQSEMADRFAREKREMEELHTSRLRGSEERVAELDKANKELTDHKYRSEAAIRELKTKLRASEEECSGAREELARLRRDNSSLDSTNHELEKTVSQLRMRVAVLEQELQDKEQVISRSSELLDASSEQKRSHEVTLEQKQRQITKLETAFKSASQEVIKGNEIIQKLQIDLRNIKSKLKLRNMVTTQQERVIGEREGALDKLRLESEAVKVTMARKDEELAKVGTSLKEALEKLEESKNELKTNENVISWLNKQMNDQMMGSGRGIPRPPLPSLSTIRSSPPSQPYTVGGQLSDIGALYTHQMQQRPQFSSTPSGPTSSHATTGPPRQALGSIASQENVRQQVLFKGPGASKGGLAPSPLSAHSLSAHSAIRGQLTPPTAGLRSKDALSKSSPGRPSGPWLDPKYLAQDLPPSELRTNVTPRVLPKQVPPASSYFPKN